MVAVVDYRTVLVVVRAVAARFVALVTDVASSSITEASAARRFTAAMPLRHDSFDS
jgi:Na+-translocating ferredoxin:NAD+ oxidoreductase RnfG subunit